MTENAEFVGQLKENEVTLHVFEAAGFQQEWQARRSDEARSPADLSKMGAAGSVAALDALTAQRMAQELGLRGRAAVVTYGGRSYVILKGYAGLRSVLTGTRYLEANPKVVQYAVGRVGLQSAIQGSGFLAVVLYTGINVLDYLMNDQVTLSRFLGTLATDLFKLGAATLAGIAAGLAVGTVTTVALAPLVVAVAVVLASTWALDALDERFGIAEALIATLDEIGETATEGFLELDRQLEWFFIGRHLQNRW